MARIRKWHESAYAELQRAADRIVSYLGLTLEVPSSVFAPTPTSDLLGRAVLDEVRAGDRVLDMGTGCGVNAILAAKTALDVVGVDLNPAAIAAAARNAARNGVADRTHFHVSDVFDAVEGNFDLIMFDPPFRWFRPRNMLEASITDVGYGALTRFMAHARDYMQPGARLLLFFGSSGDMGYVQRLISQTGFKTQVVATRQLVKDGITVTYKTWRLTG